MTALARVTMVNKYYPPHLGGIEYHLRDLSEALVARGVGVRALVVNEGPEAVTETLGGVEVTRLPRAFSLSSAPIGRGMRAALRAEAARDDAPDVFHLHAPNPPGELAWLAARPGVPTVLTYHSDIVRQRIGLTGYAPFLRRVLDRVDLVIASSPNMVEHSPFLARVADKCRVVPFGMDLARFEAKPHTLARAAELRACHTRPVVLFVGRLIYYKGAEVLVRAMASLDADLVMIGRGPLRPHLEKLAAELGIAERVTIIEPVDAGELIAWYHAAEIFCLPSVARSEAFGLVQVEAHATGTPVVSTDLTTGVPYVNRHGETGLVVPPSDAGALADALSALLSDDALRARLGEQARTRAFAEFTLQRMVERTLAVYDEARGVA